MPTIEWGTRRDTSGPFADAQNEVRQEALSRPLPSTESERWRYSPIADLVISDYRPVAPTTESTDVGAVPAVAAAIASVPNRAGLAVTHNGTAQLVEGAVTRSESMAGERPDADSDFFVLANFAYAVDPLEVVVAAGTDGKDPIVIVHYIDEPGAAVSTRLRLDVADDASAQVLEIMIIAEDISSMVLPHTDIRVGPAARVGYQFMCDSGPGSWIVGTHRSEVHQQSTYDGYFAAFGGRYCRQSIACELLGRGATGNLSAVAFGESEEVIDYRTFQHHVAPDATSNLMFKGVVDDKARSIYTGLIRVGPDASGTNAFQTNRNIKLSDDAWAESVPNLEIETNDVRCSHASTVGPIDEGQRFYLESHGVPTAEAERLIVAGFFAEVIDASPVPGIRAEITRRVEDRLKEGEA